MKIESHGGLLVNPKTKAYLGYIFNFAGKGAFSPDGKVEIPPDLIAAHNRALSEAEVKGLDENCQVGQGGTFYFVGGRVTTWHGHLVSDGVYLSPSGKWITFTRGGRQYRARLQKDADCFNFRRIS